MRRGVVVINQRIHPTRGLEMKNKIKGTKRLGAKTGGIKKAKANKEAQKKLSKQRAAAQEQKKSNKKKTDSRNLNERVRTAKGRSTSSTNWLKRQLSDPYVRKAKHEGRRSRAAYKLIELNEKHNLLKPGMRVVNLGAAPGGWSQLAAQWVGSRGHVYALDVLPMDSLADVTFVQGDFTEEAVLQQLLNHLGESQIDIVISDMAPNLSGMRAIDQPKVMYLAELALDLARQVMKPNGDMLIKVFQGEGFDSLLQQLRQAFTQVRSRKPEASRDRSREIYLLARGFKL